MPDVAVLVCVLHTVDDLLHGIELVRTKNHQTLVALMQHDVLANHLAKVALIKEKVGKLTEVVKRHVLRIRPVERKLITAVGIVGEITGIHTIADDKELDIVEESVKRGLMIPLNLVICLFQLHTTFLQFNLHQWQTVDEDSHVITAFLSSFNSYLV